MSIFAGMQGGDGVSRGAKAPNGTYATVGMDIDEFSIDSVVCSF